MIKQIIFLFIVLLATTIIKAQDFEIKESQEKIGQGTNSAYRFDIMNPDASFANRLIRQKLKNAHAKIKGRSTITASSAKISAISDSPINVYFSFKEQNTFSHIIAAFEIKDSSYINSSLNPKANEAVIKYLREYAHEVNNDYYDNLIKLSKEELLKSQKEFDELKTSRINTDKDIIRYNALLAKARQDTAKNNKDTVLIRFRIEGAQSRIEDLTKSKAKLEMAKTLGKEVEFIEVPEVKTEE